MPDILPADIPRWHEMEKRIRRFLSIYGYTEIRTPILEETELFARSIGSSTDIVEKEMFTLPEVSGKPVSLRPEGTASVLRSYLEHHLGHGQDLLKVYYLGPMFRHERPQKGRLRQFHQMGIEAIGSDHPFVDVEVMVLLMNLLEFFQTPDLHLEINSVGDEECRPAYRKILKDFLKAHAQELCENCQRRTDSNPMRVFDCKVPSCQSVLEQAPIILDHLNARCADHLASVEEGLRTAGVSFTKNPRIVRGLDYYERTAFEVTSGNLGAQNAVAAGGRYDGLAEVMGGSHTPAIGFAMGLERLLLTLGDSLIPSLQKRVEFVPLDDKAQIQTMALSMQTRQACVRSDTSPTIEFLPEPKSIKAALRRANRNQAVAAILLGSEEMKKNTATVKWLNGKDQKEIRFEDLPSYLSKELA